MSTPRLTWLEVAAPVLAVVLGAIGVIVGRPVSPIYFLSCAVAWLILAVNYRSVVKTLRQLRGES